VFSIIGISLSNSRKPLKMTILGSSHAPPRSRAPVRICVYRWMRRCAQRAHRAEGDEIHHGTGDVLLMVTVGDPGWAGCAMRSHRCGALLWPFFLFLFSFLRPRLFVFSVVRDACCMNLELGTSLGKLPL